MAQWVDAAGNQQHDAGELLSKVFSCIEDDTAWPAGSASKGGAGTGPEAPPADGREVIVPFDPLLLENDQCGPAFEAVCSAWRELCNRDGSIPNRLVGGMLQDLLSCPECGHRSSSYQPFTMLTVPVPAVHSTYTVTLIGEIDTPQAVARYWLAQS